MFGVVFAMKTVTVRLDEEEVEDLDEEAENQDISRSEYIRAILEARHDTEQEIQQLKTDNERLQRKLTEVISLKEEHEDLIRHTEEQKSLEMKKHQASLVTRMKWLVFGGDD